MIVYVATPLVGEPVEERVLALEWGQDDVDRVFWEIVHANRPPVVKTGYTNPPPAPPSPALSEASPSGGRLPIAGRRHHGRNRERSPPKHSANE